MTLIEVLLSFAILTVGLVSVFAILNAGFRSHKRAINETEAGMVAESVLAELRAEFFHSRVPNSARDFTASKDFPGYSYKCTVIPLDPSRKGVEQTFSDREYFVRVQVRWSDRGDDKSISIDTVMFCNRRL
jgi:Tfp pilus assembly protein PilV